MPSPLGHPLPPTPDIRPVVSILAQLFAKGQGSGQAPGTAPAGTPPALPAIPPGVPAASAPAWAQALASLRAPHVDLGDALARVAERLRAAGDGRSSATRGLERLLARFAGIEGLDGPALERRVAESGIHFEARLAAAGAGAKADTGKTLAQLLDLKAELLRAQAELPRGPLRQAVERALTAIEEQQLHNVARAEHGENPLLTVPLSDGDAWTTAWLQRRATTGGDGRESDGEGGARLAFGVTFSALGPIRADLTLRPDSLWVRLSVARVDVLRALDSGLTDLATRLEKDQRPVRLSVVLVDERDLATPPPVISGQLDVSA